MRRLPLLFLVFLPRLAFGVIVQDGNVFVSTCNNGTSPTTCAVSVTTAAANEKLLACAGGGTTTNLSSTPSINGGGLTWTPVGNYGVNAHAIASCWTAPVAAPITNVSVSVVWSGTNTEGVLSVTALKGVGSVIDRTAGASSIIGGSGASGYWGYTAAMATAGSWAMMMTISSYYGYLPTLDAAHSTAGAALLTAQYPQTATPSACVGQFSLVRLATTLAGSVSLSTVGVGAFGGYTYGIILEVVPAGIDPGTNLLTFNNPSFESNVTGTTEVQHDWWKTTTGSATATQYASAAMTGSYVEKLTVPAYSASYAQVSYEWTGTELLNSTGVIAFDWRFSVLPDRTPAGLRMYVEAYDSGGSSVLNAASISYAIGQCSACGSANSSLLISTPTVNVTYSTAVDVKQEVANNFAAGKTLNDVAKVILRFREESVDGSTNTHTLWLDNFRSFRKCVLDTNPSMPTSTFGTLSAATGTITLTRSISTDTPNTYILARVGTSYAASVTLSGAGLDWTLIHSTAGGSSTWTGWYLGLARSQLSSATVSAVLGASASGVGGGLSVIGLINVRAVGAKATNTLQINPTAPGSCVIYDVDAAGGYAYTDWTFSGTYPSGWPPAISLSQAKGTASWGWLSGSVWGVFQYAPASSVQVSIGTLNHAPGGSVSEGVVEFLSGDVPPAQTGVPIFIITKN